MAYYVFDQLTLFVMTASICGIFVFVGVFLWHKYFRKYVTIEILKEYGDSFEVLKTFKKPIKIDTITFENQIYYCYLTHAIFKRFRPILYFKKGNAIPISFNEKINTKYEGLSNFVNESTKAVFWRKIFHADQEKIYLLMILVLGGACAVIAIVAFYYINQLTQTITQLKGSVPPIVTA